MFTCLRRNIELVREDYDYVVIDTNPGIQRLQDAQSAPVTACFPRSRRIIFPSAALRDFLQTIIGLKTVLWRVRGIHGDVLCGCQSELLGL